jgi:hypothetical protein
MASVSERSWLVPERSVTCSAGRSRLATSVFYWIKRQRRRNKLKTCLNILFFFLVAILATPTSEKYKQINKGEKNSTVQYPPVRASHSVNNIYVYSYIWARNVLVVSHKWDYLYTLVFKFRPFSQKFLTFCCFLQLSSEANTSISNSYTVCASPKNIREHDYCNNIMYMFPRNISYSVATMPLVLGHKSTFLDIIFRKIDEIEKWFPHFQLKHISWSFRHKSLFILCFFCVKPFSRLLTYCRI